MVGEIDMATVDQFEQAVRGVATQLPRFVIDLSAVTFFGAAGIRNRGRRRTVVGPDRGRLRRW